MSLRLMPIDSMPCGCKHLHRRHAVFGNVELDLVLLEESISERPLERPAALFQRGLGRRARAHDQKVEKSILGRTLGPHSDLGHPFGAHQLDRCVKQVANDGLHVPTDIAHLGELRGLDLEERGPGETRQPPGDFSLADSGRSDHDDVLGRHFFTQLGLELLAPPTVAQGHRHCALGKRPGRR